MGVVDENVFPKLILDGVASDPAAPSNDSWKVYAKPDGVYARSSNTIMGPFGGSAGDITTDAAWAAKGDLIVATGNNAASVLTVGTDDYVLTADSGEATGLKWAAASSGGGYEPWIIDVFVFNATGNTNWNTLSNGTEVYGRDIYSSGAQNDARWWDIYIPAGTWTVILRHVKAANQGIHTIQIDGSSVGTIDAYAGGTTYDNTSTVTGVVVAASGKKTLKLLMSSKNASSSNYYGEINHLALHRTA